MLFVTFLVALSLIASETAAGASIGGSISSSPSGATLSYNASELNNDRGVAEFTIRDTRADGYCAWAKATFEIDRSPDSNVTASVCGSGYRRAFSLSGWAHSPVTQIRRLRVTVCRQLKGVLSGCTTRTIGAL